MNPAGGAAEASAKSANMLLVDLWDGGRVEIGDAAERLRELPSESVRCCVTSPPYYQQRDYGVAGQIGLERTPAEYVARLWNVFAEVRRVLTKDGTLWLNLGDTYNAYNGNRGEGGRLNSGSKHAMLAKFASGHGLTDKAMPNKSLLGMPWRVALALIDDGWILRNEIVWHKPNSKPGGGRDRLVNRHETVFMFSRSQRYYFNEDRRLDGDVWTVPVGGAGARGDHRAVMPGGLAERCILAGSVEGDTVLDPFHGSGTTGRAALGMLRRYIGIELNPAYVQEQVEESA